MNGTTNYLYAINPPTFKGGLKIICSLKALISDLDCLTDNNTLKYNELVYNPKMFEIRKLFNLQNRNIKALDESNPEASEIQKIWQKFYFSSSTEEMLQAKTEIQNWIKKHQTKTPVSLSSSIKPFTDSALVVLDSNDPSLGKTFVNALQNEKFHEVETLHKSFLDHLNPIDDRKFREIVEQLICNILSYSEGRRLVKAILEEIRDVIPPIKLTIKEAERDQFTKNETINSSSPNPIVSYTIELAAGFTSTISALDTGERRSFYTSKDTLLFHELLHFLNYLRCNGPSSTTSLTGIDYNIYTNIEEARTILGSPNTTCSENSYRKEKLLSPRYGHIEGNDELRMNNNEMLERAITHNLSGDFEWIVPKIILKYTIRDLIKKQMEIAKTDFCQEKHTEKDFEVIQNKLDNCIKNQSNCSALIDQIVSESRLAPATANRMKGIYKLRNYMKSNAVSSARNMSHSNSSSSSSHSYSFEYFASKTDTEQTKISSPSTSQKKGDKRGYKDTDTKNPYSTDRTLSTPAENTINPRPTIRRRLDFSSSKIPNNPPTNPSPIQEQLGFTLLHPSTTIQEPTTPNQQEPTPNQHLTSPVQQHPTQIQHPLSPNREPTTPIQKSDDDEVPLLTKTRFIFRGPNMPSNLRPFPKP